MENETIKKGIEIVLVIGIAIAALYVNGISQTNRAALIEMQVDIIDLQGENWLLQEQLEMVDNYHRELHAELWTMTLDNESRDALYTLHNDNRLLCLNMQEVEVLPSLAKITNAMESDATPGKWLLVSYDQGYVGHKRDGTAECFSNDDPATPVECMSLCRTDSFKSIGTEIEVRVTE